MKALLLQVSDELFARLGELAQMERRTVEDFSADRLDLFVFGHNRRLPPMTEAERQALRKRVIRVPRVNLKAKDRNRIFEAHDGKCYHCHGQLLYDDMWHIDHLMPLAKGGTNDPSNLVLSCPRCNIEKRDKVLAA